MSSSIEEQFDPPEWATREEVINAARHYINYWKIEARQRNAQWLQGLEDTAKAKSELKQANEELFNIRLNITQDPVLVAVIKDAILHPRKKDNA